MSITFNQFLSRIDEAFPTWRSSPRIDKPTGQLSRRPSTRGRTGPQLDWKAPETKPKKPTTPKPSGGVSYVSVTPEPEKPKAEVKTPKPKKDDFQLWIPGFPALKDRKVKPHKKPKLPKPQKRQKSPKPKITQLKLKLKEFVELYRQSITES